MDAISILMGNEHSICRLKVQLNEISEKVTPTIRGSVTLAKVLPKAKRFTFLVFATEEEAKELENIETASVVVGGEKLIQKILEGSFDFSNISNCLSTFGIYPEMKNKIAKVLGPLQLMPTEKKGTLTKNPAETINMLASKTEIKTDEKGFIRNDVGKTFWPIQDLQVSGYRICIDRSSNKELSSFGGGTDQDDDIDHTIIYIWRMNVQAVHQKICLSWRSKQTVKLEEFLKKAI
ncbi:14169_t:CDS:2 [Entrophospora sp. SA101]|nr:14169_t:CDS:2 [Entrophospora sp. SA101]